MKMLMTVTVMLACAQASAAFEAEQVFRPERVTRGNVNIRALQPIDKAVWIWTEKPIRAFLSVV